MEELGPTFIKFGQILSVRPDLVPLDLCNELSKLQDHVPPFGYDDVRKQIKESFVKYREELFASFDPDPLAAASLGQVHRAQLDTGENVVVKVQRPDIRKMIETDPRACVETCAVKVITPFGNDTELAYNFPWTIQSGTFYNFASQLLPDQSLLFVGDPYSYLSNTPAAVKTYPDLTGEDRPLFRLTPDGQPRLVGIYAGSVSDDGRYILLRASDHSSFFIYDAVADRPLFEPIDLELEDYFVMSTRFYDTGILVNLSPSVPGEKNVYRFFYHAYVYETSASIAWEDINAEINSCPDLLEDGTLVCWFYRADFSNFDLVRFDPATGKKTVPLENSWLIEFTP